jgi:thiosulfate/3-mercaptopyruvate sulfurtransferase
MYITLLSYTTLLRELDNPDWIIVDCRYDLANPDAGYNEYLASHIPRAVYAHLDRDLSDPPLTNRGRHPLPAADALSATFGRLGIDAKKQVVVYDGAGGSICARLWWLLHYMGHEAAAVLDGGWPVAASLPTSSGAQANAAAWFTGRPQDDRIVTIENVMWSPLLIDSRDPARYRGEHEPIDRAAGHIPGAINHFWKDNLTPTMEFLPPSELHSQFATLFGRVAAADAVFYCGSGVTACHNLLAAKHAGLALPRLYAGSWSEWSADPQRPVATGAV